jgi:hypothetical protein
MCSEQPSQRDIIQIRCLEDQAWAKIDEMGEDITSMIDVNPHFYDNRQAAIVQSSLKLILGLRELRAALDHDAIDGMDIIRANDPSEVPQEEGSGEFPAM